MAATQAGQASTMAASQAGTMSTVAAGFVGLIVGLFLGLTITDTPAPEVALPRLR